MLQTKKIAPRTKTPEQALAALMRLCARAERAEEDARRLLVRWGIAPADQQRILERLRRDGRPLPELLPDIVRPDGILVLLAGLDYATLRLTPQATIRKI